MESALTVPNPEVSPRWTNAWRGAAALIFALYLSRSITANRDDFLAYFAAGERALQGITPYAREETPFRYLPLTAYFFIPLTLFSISVARVVFFILNFAAVVAFTLRFESASAISRRC
jgi:hypothetical protein